MRYPFILSILVLLLSSCVTAPTKITPEVSADNATEAPEFNHTASGSSVPNSPLRPSANDTELSALPDVWVRIQKQITIQVADRPEIAAERRFYARQKKFFNDVALRADPFLYHVVTRLEQRGMPVELALIPIVESSYNPQAKGAGPAGLWQMMPQTAKNFGLKMNYWYDGRHDAIASTEAVLDLLQYLHDHLENDWLNAVAGYNAGEARIQNAILRNKAKGKPTDFYSLNIPVKYTKTVPKWLALIDIVKDPAKHQLTLTPIANQPKFQLAKIKGPIDLNDAANIAGLSLSQLKRFNTGFKRNTTSPQGPHEIAIPYAYYDNFTAKSASLKIQKLSNTQSYKIKKGDTLGSIAAKYGVSVQALKKMNGLKKGTLSVGQTLQLPLETRPKAAKKATTYTVVKGDNLWLIGKKLKIDTEQLRVANRLKVGAELKPGQQLSITTATQLAKKSSKKTNAAGQMYTVQSGDSLDKIAKKHKVKLADLLKWNRLQKSSVIQPGMKIMVSSKI